MVYPRSPVGRNLEDTGEVWKILWSLGKGHSLMIKHLLGMQIVPGRGSPLTLDSDSYKFGLFIFIIDIL